MTTTLTGTFVDGAIQLDQPVDLPNHSRVIVQVQVQPPDDWRERVRLRLAEWQRFCDENPMGSGGEKFNREALYEDA